MKSYLKIHFLEYLKLIPRKRAIIFYSLLMLFLFVLVGLSPVNANILKYVDFKQNERLETCGTVTDIDGNIYETVMVAGECWIKSNLKVKHYRNGDPIPEIQDQKEWTDAKTGAWCYYNNDPANEEKYGLLYNFYAVTDPRGLAPEGWEVPSYCEILNLRTTDYGYENALKILRAEDHLRIQFGGNRRRGFTDVPFTALNTRFTWWTSTSGTKWTGLGLDFPIVVYGDTSSTIFNFDGQYYEMNDGISARLIKTKEKGDILNLPVEVIYNCDLLPTFQSFVWQSGNFDHRPNCTPPYNAHLCFDKMLVTVYENEISSSTIVNPQTRIQRDKVYYFYLSSTNNIGSESNSTQTCNGEYKAFIFKMPVLPVPEGNAEQFFCGSARIADFEVTGENLVWFATEDSDQELAIDLPLENGKKYYVSQRTSGCELGERLEVTARISQPSVSTGAAVQEFCHGAVIGDLEVEGDNILWYDAEGNQLPLSAGLAHDAIYTAVTKEGDCESGALEIRIVLKSTPAPQAEAVQSFCDGAVLSDIEVSGESLQFYENAESSTPVGPQSLLQFGKEYFVSQTIEGCESRDKTRIKVELKEIPLPQADAVQVFCNQAIISDLGAVGENIRWYKDQSLTVIMDAGTALENQESYFVTQTVDGCESSAVEVKVAINAPEKPTGDTVQEFCGSANLSDLIITGENIRWYSDQNDTQAINGNIALVDGRTYYATQTLHGCESAERLGVTAKINRPSVPTGATVQEFCFTAMVSDLVVEGNDVLWYDSEGNSLVSSDLLSHNGIYKAVSKEGDCESAALEIRIILKSPLAPQTDAVQVFCNQAIVSDLGAVGENIRWYKDQSLTVIIDAGTALENQESYFVTQTVDGCESSAVEVKVTINAPEKPTGDTDQEFCGSANLSDLIITGENIRWYSDQNDTQAINGNIALVDGRTYYATQTLHGCESAERLAVNIQIYRPDRPIGQIFQSVCAGSLLEELNVDGIGLTWYDVASGGNPISPTTLLEHGRSYFVSQIVGGCESERLRISVEILPSILPVAEDQQTFCASSAPKVKDLFAVGEQVLWFLSETGGNPLSDDVQLENGISYFASNFNSIGCESPSRKKVEVVIQVCEVEVYNLVTMDDNDKNAYFKIKDIEYFPENRLEVFNRYGVLVYTQISYGQDGNFFYGMSNVSGVRDAARGLPTGNYLYVLTYKVPADGRMEKVNGYLHLINTKR